MAVCHGTCIPHAAYNATARIKELRKFCASRSFELLGRSHVATGLRAWDGGIVLAKCPPPPRFEFISVLMWSPVYVAMLLHQKRGGIGLRKIGVQGCL